MLGHWYPLLFGGAGVATPPFAFDPVVGYIAGEQRKRLDRKRRAEEEARDAERAMSEALKRAEAAAAQQSLERRGVLTLSPDMVRESIARRVWDRRRQVLDDELLMML